MSNFKRQRVSNVKDHVKKGQKVKVKVLSMNAGKTALSMKEVDQETGEDIGRDRPHSKKVQYQSLSCINIY